MRVSTGIAITISATIGFGLGYYLDAGEKNGDSFFSTDAARPAAPISAPQEPALSLEEVEASREQYFADVSTIREILLIPTDFAQTEALYALAGRSDIRQLKVLIGEADGIALSGDREAALQILFSRYADIDTRQALIYLDALNLDVASSIIRGIFHSWAKIDPDEAIATANQINDPYHRKTATEAIMRTIADQSPELLDQVADQLVATINTDQFEIERLIRQAATDPDGALADALALDDKRLMQQAIYGITLNLAKRDPRHALAVAEQIPNQQIRQQVTQAIVQQWARNDPEGAMAFARTENIGDADHLITVALQNMARTDPLAALDQAAQLNARAKQSTYAGIYSVWGQQDVRAAISHAESLNDPQLERQVFSSLARQYADKFPDEALMWAEQLEGPAREAATGAVLRQIAASDPRLALDVALSTSATPTRNDTVSQIFGTLAATDPQAAVTYLNQLPDGPIRDRSIQNIIQSWAMRDPDAAYVWVDQLEGKTYTQTVLKLAHQLSSTNPDRAAQLTDQIRGNAKPEWLKTVARGYARTDHQGAVSWLKQYSQEPGYAQALASITQVTAQTDPVAALNLAEDISSATDKKRAIDDIARTWSSRDPAAAASWADTIKDTQQRNSSIQITASRWARTDPDAAGQWVMGLSNDEARDRALVALVHQAADSTDTAMPLVNAIGSAQGRVQATISLVNSLARYDPAAAERALSQANIDAQSRAQIQQRLQARKQR